MRKEKFVEIIFFVSCKIFSFSLAASFLFIFYRIFSYDITLRDLTELKNLKEVHLCLEAFFFETVFPYNFVISWWKWNIWHFCTSFTVMLAFQIYLVVLISSFTFPVAQSLKNGERKIRFLFKFCDSCSTKCMTRSTELFIRRCSGPISRRTTF